MLTEADILDALRACFDSRTPVGRPLNIVDLGLVETISLTLDAYAPGAGIPGVPPRQALHVVLLAPTADEDSNAILKAQVANRLAGLAELSHTTVAFANESAWSHARISPEGRRLLDLDAAPFAILNNRPR